MQGIPTKPALARIRGVLTESEARQGDATTLASALGIPLLIRHAVQSDPGDFILTFTSSKLELRSLDPGKTRPLHIDFANGAAGFRRWSAQSRKQPLARAVGVKGSPPTVVDATAGLGRDAFLLACLGCSVTLLERSPVLHALLADGLKRARGVSSAVDAVLARMTLHFADARTFLTALPVAQQPDVVYLDPMYTPAKRSAISKKEVRLCRELVGDDSDAAELFDVARRIATGRVVVKRHPSAAPLAPDPTIRYPGRTVRYDAYLRAPINSGSGM